MCDIFTRRYSALQSHQWRRASTNHTSSTRKPLQRRQTAPIILMDTVRYSPDPTVRRMSLHVDQPGSVASLFHPQATIQVGERRSRRSRIRRVRRIRGPLAFTYSTSHQYRSSDSARKPVAQLPDHYSGILPNVFWKRIPQAPTCHHQHAPNPEGI